MACSACAKRRNQTRYQVLTAEGRVVYNSTNKATAESVAKRYNGATVKEIKPQGTPTP